MPDLKISEAYAANPSVAEGDDRIPIDRVGDTVARAVTAQSIANLAPAAAGQLGGTRVGSALNGANTTNVLPTFQAAVAACPVGGTLTIDPGTAGASFRINDTWIIDKAINVDMGQCEITFTFTDRPAIVYGSATAVRAAKKLRFNTRGVMSSAVFQAATNINGIGVKFINVRDSDIELRTERSFIGHEMYSEDAIVANKIKGASLDHHIHINLWCRGDSADENATPGSAIGGEYINANNWYWSRMDNTSVLGSSDSIGINFKGTHGGYNRVHGNHWDIGLHQPQGSLGGAYRRRLVHFDRGQNAARNNTFIVGYVESGNGHLGEIHASNSSNNGNVITVKDSTPGDPADYTIGWTGGSLGFSTNFAYGPQGGANPRFCGYDRRSSWESGNLVDYINYYNDGAITLGYGMYKLTTNTAFTNQSTIPSANVTPRENSLAIQTGGIFFWLNTEVLKQFVIWRTVAPGFGGRLMLCPCDVNKNPIAGGNELIVATQVGSVTASEVASTDYVGVGNALHVQSVDSDAPVNVNVSTACKWLLFGVRAGSNACHLKSFGVSSVDNINPGAIHVDGDPAVGDRRGRTGLAAKIPAISTGGVVFGYGRYRRGDVLENDGSVTSRAVTKRWVCPANMILAPTWQPSFVGVGLGTLRTGTVAAGADGNVYRCVVAGNSAAGNGPTGTSSSTLIVDGTARWLYYGPAFQAWSAEA